MLRFCDSFDHYATADIEQKYETSSNDFANLFIESTARYGTALRVEGYDSRYLEKALDSQATWIIGFAFYLDTMAAASHQILELVDTASRQVTVRMNTDFTMSVTRDGTVLGTTSSPVVTLDNWYYLEFKVTIDNAGSYELRISGVNVLSGSADTQASANASANRIRLGSSGGGFTGIARYDDLYVCDGTGGVNDDFLGDVRVEALLPNGNGTTSDLDGSDGNSTDNYLLVDEAAPDDNTTYVESLTVGDKDTYAFANLVVTSGGVFGVQPLAHARKTDAGSRSVATISRLSGIEEDSADFVLIDSYKYQYDIREEIPGGGSWTIADVNNAEFGMKVTA